MASIAEFSRAIRRLGEALREPKTEIVRDATIQRFEFTVELGWKTARRVAGIATAAPKDVVRELGRSGYIDTVQVWLQAIDRRNETAHTYNEEAAERVYAFAKDFLCEAEALLAKLEEP